MQIVCQVIRRFHYRDNFRNSFLKWHPFVANQRNKCFSFRTGISGEIKLMSLLISENRVLIWNRKFHAAVFTTLRNYSTIRFLYFLPVTLQLSTMNKCKHFSSCDNYWNIISWRSDNAKYHKYRTSAQQLGILQEYLLALPI